MITIKQLLLMKALKVVGGAWATIKGIIAHFTDGTANPLRSLKASIDPVQDLHGQDSPYPAGGGKQLLDPSTFTTYDNNGIKTTINADGTVSLSGTATAATYAQISPYTLLSNYGFIQPDTQYMISGGYGNNSTYLAFGVNGAGTDYRDTNGNGATFSFTAEQISTLQYRLFVYVQSGTNVDGITIKPMICLASASNPNVFAPYSNICPITGHTGVNVYVTGENVWDEEWEVGGYAYASGAKTNQTDRIRNKNQIPVLPNTKYYISGPTALLFYDSTGAYLSYNSLDNARQFTTPSGCYFMAFFVDPNYGTTYNHDISINYPSTDTTYHAYTGQTYSVQFPALGKNLFDENQIGEPTSDVGVFVNSDGTLTVKTSDSSAGVSATKKGTNTAAKLSDLAPDLVVGQTYALSLTSTGTAKYIYLSVSADIWLPNASRTITQNDLNSIVYFYASGISTTATVSNFQIEKGTSPTSYEPYTNTVYSGTLDVVSGELVVDMKMVEFDGSSDENWTLQSINSHGIANFYIGISPAYKSGSETKSFSNMLTFQSTVIAETTTAGYHLSGGSTLYARIESSIANTVASFKTWLSENKLQLCYELATPITYQLTPTEVDSLLGTNNIWNDCGETEVTYKKA